jgi:hypothetical protein
MASLRTAFTGALMLFVSLAPGVTVAQEREHEREREHGGPPHRVERWHEGDIARFREHDLDRWRGGRWLHAVHEGRLGWWWVVDGTWYFYPAPVYPYPDPYVPPVVAAPETPPATWYYCASQRQYYPYVSACPEGWRPVAANPAPPPNP